MRKFRCRNPYFYYSLVFIPHIIIIFYSLLSKHICYGLWFCSILVSKRYLPKTCAAFCQKNKQTKQNTHTQKKNNKKQTNRKQEARSLEKNSCCYATFVFSILSLQLMKGSSFKQFLVLKKKKVFFLHFLLSYIFFLFRG